MGKLNLQTGKPELAISDLKAVAQLDPTEASVHYLLAQAYRKLGRPADQKAELELFDKFKRDEQERSKPPTILMTGAPDESSEEKPEEMPLAK